MNKDHTLLLELFDQALHSRDMTIMEKFDLTASFRTTLLGVEKTLLSAQEALLEMKKAPSPTPAAPRIGWILQDKWGYHAVLFSAKAILDIIAKVPGYVSAYRQQENGNATAFTCTDDWKTLREWADSHPD